MRTSTKVVFNTVILYVKIIASMAIALITVPLVLRALGASDYGLYNLIAGVVAMLSFLNNSLAVSSQRYMSVAMGTKDNKRIDDVFNASFRIHLIIGIVLVLLLEIGSIFIDRLNIAPDRINTAFVIYQSLVISSFVKIINVPFNAITNAHEDMLAFAIIDITDSLLMLILAFSLQYISFDKLVFYGYGVSFISICYSLLFYFWTRHAYKDYRISFKNTINPLLVKEMFGFSGWNVFGGVAVVGRNQGVAVIINMFLGTIANAAYGVANHINGALLHFTSTFQKAINPQLMKSEGMNDRDRLHRISFISSKFSVLAICFFAIPLILEMPEVLHLWLRDDIPPFTIELSQYILLLSIVYQYSSGLMSSIQASGNIRNYQIIMSIIILLNLPASYFLLRMGYPIYYVTAAYVVIELISLVIRVFMAHRITGMKIRDYLMLVVKPTFIIIILSTIISLFPHYLMKEGFFRLLITCFVYGSVFLLLIWFFAFDLKQRYSIKTRVFSIINRHKALNQ